jgi:hypothetical protein
MANIVVTKNQPNPRCFNAAKATALSLGEVFVVVVERGSKAATVMREPQTSENLGMLQTC